MTRIDEMKLLWNPDPEQLKQTNLSLFGKRPHRNIASRKMIMKVCIVGPLKILNNSGKKFGQMHRSFAPNPTEG